MDSEREPARRRDMTQWMRHKKAITSMTIGMFIMPFSAFAMSLGPWLNDAFGSSIMGLHPFTFMLVVGIALQGLAECFISPRFLEYFSLQAPKGEEGLYLGFSHLDSFLSSIFGFGISGILLTKYCPDPALFESRAAWEAASANAHYIWYYFAAIGLISAISLLIFALITRHIDRKKRIEAA